MIRQDRIRQYNFAVGSLIGDSKYVDTYSDEIVNGEILKISYSGGNWSANGSVWLMTSGTNETIWYRQGTANQPFQIYPFVYGTDAGGSSGSPHIGANRVVSAQEATLRVVASGIGAGSATTFNVFWK